MVKGVMRPSEYISHVKMDSGMLALGGASNAGLWAQ